MILTVVDLRTKPDKAVPRSDVPNDVVIGLVPMIRNECGTITGQWSFKIERTFLRRHSVPGTAFGLGREMPPSVVVGIRFNVSHGTIGIVLSGWLAWLDDPLIAQLRDDIIETIDRNRESLGSLSPGNQLDWPASPPWLAVLRMPPWRQLSEDQQNDLDKLPAYVGWAAIEVLSKGGGDAEPTHRDRDRILSRDSLGEGGFGMRLVETVARCVMYPRPSSMSGTRAYGTRISSSRANG